MKFNLKYLWLLVVSHCKLYFHLMSKIKYIKWTSGTFFNNQKITSFILKERPYRDRYKSKTKQHFLGCSHSKRTIHQECTLKGRRRGSRQKRISIAFMTSFYCLKAYTGEGGVWKLPNLQVNTLLMVPNTFLTFNSKKYRTINNMKVLIFFYFIMKQ